MRDNIGDRRSGKDRRSGSDRRRFEDRRKFRDRRSGEDRRKLTGHQNRGAVKKGRESIDEEPECQRCIATLGQTKDGREAQFDSPKRGKNMGPSAKG